MLFYTTFYLWVSIDVCYLERQINGLINGLLEPNVFQWPYIHGPLSNINKEGTFILDFLDILKHLLQNFLKIL